MVQYPQYGKLISLWLSKVEVFLLKSSPYVTKDQHMAPCDLATPPSGNFPIHLRDLEPWSISMASCSQTFINQKRCVLHLHLLYQPIGMAPDIRGTLGQYHRDTPGERFLEGWWLWCWAPRVLLSISQPMAQHPHCWAMRYQTAWCNAQLTVCATIRDRRTHTAIVHVAWIWLVDK